MQGEGFMKLAFMLLFVSAANNSPKDFLLYLASEARARDAGLRLPAFGLVHSHI